MQAVRHALEPATLARCFPEAVGAVSERRRGVQRAFTEIEGGFGFCFGAISQGGVAVAERAVGEVAGRLSAARPWALLADERGRFSRANVAQVRRVHSPAAERV